MARRQALFQVCQGLAHAGPEGQAARCRLHPLTAAHHQFVADDIPQPPHGVADGGLGDGQLVGSPCQAAFGHDLVEHPQQVEVQGAEVQGVHGPIITSVNV